MSTEAPYGSWKSPLSSKLASDSSVSIKEIQNDPSTPGLLYWSELRPKENGRTIVFSKDINNAGSTPERWTPDDKNVADKVHEYGGGSFFVHGGDVYFSNFDDQKIYRQSRNAPPVPITREASHRYADGRFSGTENFFFSVCEDHSGVGENQKEPVNTIVVINVKTGDEAVVASGYDFYACPRVSPDGTKLAWMQWKHPNMPWDDTEIWIGDITSEENSIKVKNQRKIAGEKDINFMEPRWTFSNTLLYISDRTGWWNLYLTTDFVTSKNLYKVEKEIGGPMWEFGHMSYSPHPVKTDLVAVLYDYNPSILNIVSGASEPINVGGYKISSCLFQPGGNHLTMLATHATKSPCILMYDMNSKQVENFHQPMKSILDEGYISVPEHIEFPVDGGKAVAYGYYYKPTNKDFHSPAGTLPPLLINIHGGPTGQSWPIFNMMRQYFTSRGIAILDVNYRGSTGYGTAYRKALYGNWGICDVEDACAGALHIASSGLVDKDKLLIDGGSAGGFTTLACLTFRKVFSAGVSYYGVSDLSALAKHTHKFESRYIDEVVAPYPSGAAIYDERSPIKHLDQFETPTAFFQGELDKVVPPDQAREMYNKINEKGITCALIMYPDEGHGFKKSQNKQKTLDGEFYFYSKILHFTAADQGIEIPIENLPKEMTQ